VARTGPRIQRYSPGVAFASLAAASPTPILSGDGPDQGVARRLGAPGDLGETKARYQRRGPATRPTFHVVAFCSRRRSLPVALSRRIQIQEWPHAPRDSVLRAGALAPFEPCAEESPQPTRPDLVKQVAWTRFHSITTPPHRVSNLVPRPPVGGRPPPCSCKGLNRAAARGPLVLSDPKAWNTEYDGWEFERGHPGSGPG
jgi:hypothetical protein